MINKTLALLVCASLGLVACGGDSPVADLAVAVTHDLATAAGADMAAIEACAPADFIDATTDANKRTISPWDTSLGKKCLHIKISQTVTWSPAPSATHPLEATGGTTPSPITNSATATFTAAGTYGFDCGNHHSLMHGAILVD